MKITKPCLIVYAAALLVAGATSCRKLDEYNPTGSTADAVFSTPVGMLTLVNACYSDQRNFYGKEDAVIMTEAGSDLWFNADRANYVNQFTRYEGITPLLGTNRNAFTTFYKALNLCNAGISRIQNVVYPSITEKNTREAEMRYMRAFYLWHIVEFWGGARLDTTETQGAVLTATRSPVSAFYDVILNDLRFAQQNLPVTWSSGNTSGEYSRATRKSAYGLMARAALSRAYYATGAEATTYFTMARDAAKYAIDNKVALRVDLNPDYAALWLPANNKLISRDNGEAMYTISNSVANTSSNFDLNANRMHLWYLMQYSGKIGGLAQSFDNGLDNQRRLMPALALLDLYNDTTDARYSGSFQEVWIANAAYTWTTADANRFGKNASVVGRQMRSGIDTAMLVTKKSIPNKASLPYLVFDRDSTYNASTTRTIRGPNNFVALKKFAYPNRPALNSQPGYNDIFVIRFAEMYLIAAEAELQLGNRVNAATYINVLRTRAARKTPVNQTAAMQITANDVTLDFILDERAREFAGEQQRWFDVKRTKNAGNFASYIRARNPDITAVQDAYRLRPIPQEELQALLNGTEFGQNPGY